MESISVIAALGLMLSAVLCKGSSVRLIDRMKVRIDGIEKEHQGTRNQLKSTQALHQVAAKNLKKKELKLTKLKRAERRLKRELKNLEAGTRKQDRRRVDRDPKS